jgi:hypothetical protein
VAGLITRRGKIAYLADGCTIADTRDAGILHACYYMYKDRIATWLKLQFFNQAHWGLVFQPYIK